MPTLSVIVITLNEEKNLQNCLDSIKWADEIIVVDSGSTDKTIEIANKYTDKVYHQDWLGFGPQKNKALSYASSEWIFSIDSDEVVTPELKAAIKQAINTKPDNSSFKLLRQSFFLGQLIKHGDWKDDWVVRLFKRESHEFTSDIIHEKLNADKKSATPLGGILLHYSQESLSQSLNKMNSYSNATSLTLFNKGRSTTIIKANIHKHWTFIRGFLLKKGFLDGKRGYLIAKLTAYGAYFKYLKLWEKQVNNKE